MQFTVVIKGFHSSAHTLTEAILSILNGCLMRTINLYAVLTNPDKPYVNGSASSVQKGERGATDFTEMSCSGERSSRGGEGKEGAIIASW